MNPWLMLVAGFFALSVLVHGESPGSCSASEDSGKCSSCELKEYFNGIPKIEYEGPNSKNPMAFRYYNAEEIILGKPMKEWLRFSVAFWHTFRGDGSDPFGSPTKNWPWEDPSLPPLEMAKKRMEANFEFLQKLGVEYWCFHDRDIAPEGEDLAETNANLDEIIDVALELQKATGIKPLWGTAQLFKHPRYMHGAATGPDAGVFAFAAAQVKKAMEVTHRLGGLNYVFWGGREGYHTLRNTDLRLELDNMARFLALAAKYKDEIGFTGTLLLEPKPQEPTKHQYDWDVATTMGFLLSYGLDDDFKINVECNHATLAGHSCEHELAMASAYGMLGNVDANTGDAQTGWDTDQFLTDPLEATLLMSVIVKQGGLSPGGFNFDAKLRRESTAVEDLFYAHIGGMDALARGLRNAAKISEDGIVNSAISYRYKSYSSGIGKDIVEGKIGFKELEKYALENPDPVENLRSGEAEKAEVILSMYV
ncbi:hypothetical protein BSKO_10765 [Bryopsis sp. KO-2023]|nr:hypothetical protein BSKO_10765 [Bryopsis sp. KO-2023]